MNIAICISGSIRYPELGLKSISKIIPNNTKIFIHTWKNVNSGKFLKTIHRLEAKEGIKEMIDTDFNLFQYPYEMAGRKGVSSMLSKVQVTELKEYKPTTETDFDVIEGGDAAADGSVDF